MLLSKLGIIVLLVILLAENGSLAFSVSSRRLGRLVSPPTSYDDEHFCLSAKIDPNEDREGSLAAATKALGKVPYGETSRKYRRTVFKHDDWVNHR